jgi:hypothetical protein
MARAKQSVRLSCTGNPPKSGALRQSEHREKRKRHMKLMETMSNVSVLFIVSDSHLKKVEVQPHHIPWASKLLRNHCIFALNNVHTATSVLTGV